MSEIQPDIATINAYVDGELQPLEAARMAEAIALDPQLASMVAKLYAMKSAVGSAFGNQEVIAINHRKPFCVPMSVCAMAACLLFVLIGGGVWYLLAQRAPGDVITQAILEHDNWALKSQETPAPVIAASVLAIPDLTPAGLTLAGVQKNVLLGKTLSTRYAYIGNRSCKLSLFVSSQNNAFEGLGSLTRPDALIVKWAVANRSFLLIARNMNHQRFKVITTALEAATAKVVPLDEPMRQALMQSHQPCLT